jgi:hypothetical protein
VRAVRCWCDELVVADDDEALAAELARHAQEAHPDDVRSDGEVEAWIAERAEEPPDRPPWAY